MARTAKTWGALDPSVSTQHRFETPHPHDGTRKLVITILKAPGEPAPTPAELRAAGLHALEVEASHMTLIEREAYNSKVAPLFAWRRQYDYRQQ